MTSFSLLVDDALAALKPVAVFAASERSSVPIFKHVLIKSTGGRCVAIGCNGAQSIIRNVPVDDNADFSVCLDGVKLRAVLDGLRDLSGKKMNISWDDSKATISVGRSKLSVAVVDPNGFPSPDRLSGDCHEVVLDAATLVGSFQAVNHAFAHNDVRHYLNGCHLAVSDGVLAVTGSDGHRISRTVASLSASSSFSGILPIRFLDMCGSLAKAGQVRLRMSSTMVDLTWADGQIRSTLIDGKYPDVTGFFQEGKPLFQCSKVSLLSCINRLKPTAFEKLPSLCIEPSGQGELRLFTIGAGSDDEVGEDFVDADVVGDLDAKLSVNIGYLSDCIGQIEDDLVDVCLVAGNSMRVSGVSQKDFNAVIAQLRR